MRQCRAILLAQKTRAEGREYQIASRLEGDLADLLDGRDAREWQEKAQWSGKSA